MRKPIEMNSGIDPFDIIDFCRVCNEASLIDDLVSHATDIAVRRAGIDAVALVLAKPESGDNVIVGTHAELGASARIGIRAYGAHLLQTLTGETTPLESLSLRQIQGGTSDPLGRPLDVARVVWSINFGPSKNPIGALAFFSHRNSGIDADHLRGIEAICPLIASAIGRIRSIDATQTEAMSKTVPETMGIVSISHVNIIDQVFGHDDAQRVVTDVIRRMAGILPINSRIGRLAIDQLGFTVPKTRAIDIRLVAEQIKHDCADLEIANAVQISVKVITARTVPASQADIALSYSVGSDQQKPSMPASAGAPDAQVG